MSLNTHVTIFAGWLGTYDSATDSAVVDEVTVHLPDLPESASFETTGELDTDDIAFGHQVCCLDSRDNPIFNVGINDPDSELREAVEQTLGAIEEKFPDLPPADFVAITSVF